MFTVNISGAGPSILRSGDEQKTFLLTYMRNPSFSPCEIVGVFTTLIFLKASLSQCSQVLEQK